MAKQSVKKTKKVFANIFAINYGDEIQVGTKKKKVMWLGKETMRDFDEKVDRIAKKMGATHARHCRVRSPTSIYRGRSYPLKLSRSKTK